MIQTNNSTNTIHKYYASPKLIKPLILSHALHDKDLLQDRPHKTAVRNT